MILIDLFEQGLGLIWPGIFTKRNNRSHMFETLLQRSIKMIYIIKLLKSTNLKEKIRIQNSNLKFENLNFEFFFFF